MSSQLTALCPEGYRRRLIDDRLAMLLQAFGAVEIVGPKWCGKTWSARRSHRA